MRVVSVNVSGLRDALVAGKPVRTGIYKRPVEGPVACGPLGLEGDSQGDQRVHGGPHMALYFFAHEQYGHWNDALSRRDLGPGFFGENITCEGLDDHDVRIGDVYRLGEALRVQVSLPRAPCATLAMVMGDATFPKQFLAWGHVGFYARVLSEGPACAGDAIVREERDPAALSVAEISRVRHFENHDNARVRRALACPGLGPSWRAHFEGLLAKRGLSRSTPEEY